MYFLFNVKQNKYWMGNTSSYVLLNNFRHKTSIEQALEGSIEYFELDKNLIEATLKQLVDDLVKKGFIDKYDDK